MNVKILDSWLREYLKTSVTPSQIEKSLSLTSASVERLEKVKDDFLYDIEVTTNRVDLMSVLGIAKEGEASLSQSGKNAKFISLSLKKPVEDNEEKVNIKNNPKLVNRICAAVLSVNVKGSPKYIKERLEASGIRSLNNLIDVTNYVMREVGHPAHVFDFDKIPTKIIVVRESSKGEKIKTLDGKEYVLPGGDIVADDGEGNIIDLLGIMGLENSVVSESTRKILFFIDNNDPHRIRKTSMGLGIRTEASILNEKRVDPEKAYEAFLRGVDLYKEIADAKVISPIYDIYPNRHIEKTVTVSVEKVSKIIGAKINKHEMKSILLKLDFGVLEKGNNLVVTVPSSRAGDIEIEEDIIEEVARIYGYHKLPSVLPPQENTRSSKYTNQFFWEERAKEALKYWEFTETYTNSMVSKDLFEEKEENAVTIQNPLNSDLLYMRRTIVPSLLQVLKENPKSEEIKIFELANVYIKKINDLPNEVMTLAGIFKKPNVSFYEVKGAIEQLFADLGIEPSFKKSQKVSVGASVYANKKYVGEIEVFDNNIIDFELNFEELIKHATLKKTYKPIAKYPPIIEDLAFVISDYIETQSVIEAIINQSPLITDVTLLDQYSDSRTFHVVYQDPNKNLTNEEVAKIREKIISSLKEKFSAKLKGKE